MPSIKPPFSDKRVGEMEFIAIIYRGNLVLRIYEIEEGEAGKFNMNMTLNALRILGAADLLLPEPTIIMHTGKHGWVFAPIKPLATDLLASAVIQIIRWIATTPYAVELGDPNVAYNVELHRNELKPIEDSITPIKVKTLHAVQGDIKHIYDSLNRAIITFPEKLEVTEYAPNVYIFAKSITPQGIPIDVYESLKPEAEPLYVIRS